MSRVLKDDVLDLPPKLYSKIYFEITKEQKKLYKELAEEFISELDDGTFITAELAIVRLLRFQQIVSGYISNDEGELRLIEGGNPRLKLALEWADRLPHKAIIWCRFTKDIELLMDNLKDRAVNYNGTLSGDERFHSLTRFKEDDNVQFFVAQIKCASRGLTITEAKSALYYTNNFSLRDRLQSEDRPHRIGQNSNVHIVDLVASQTVDEHIIKSLLTKFDIASQITGDEMKRWI
jgi:SNF2 family DNA or RNA helicase